jgi:signal transduction histidine kinase
MSAQVEYLWILVGTVVIGATAITLALYIIYHNRKELANKVREVQILKEKHEVEFRLQRANRMAIIGALAGGMAYFLNHTLFSIHSLMEMVKGEIRGQESVAHIFGLMTEEIQRGLSITKSLQHLAHPDQIALSPISVADLLGSASDHFKTQIPELIRVTTHVESAPSVILGNQKLLQRVLDSLLSNAVEAMPDGGDIELSVSQKNDVELGKKLGTGSTGDYLLLQVDDTGMGMSEDIQHRIFEPFFTTKSSADKLGLGLPITYGIVKFHNGHMSIDSKLGRGTTVAVYFPIPTDDQLHDVTEISTEEHTPATLDSLSLEDRMLLIQQKFGEA